MNAQRFLYLKCVMPDYFVPMYTFIGAVSIANYICLLYPTMQLQLCYELSHVHVATIVVIFIERLASICMAGTVNIMIYCDFTCTMQPKLCIAALGSRVTPCVIWCAIYIGLYQSDGTHEQHVANSLAWPLNRWPGQQGFITTLRHKHWVAN